MGKLFGTDGIRGVVNETLDSALAFRVGQAAAISLQEGKTKKPLVVIGMDTRISSDMLEGALVAGLTACGADVVRMGVISTPAVAFLTVQIHADAGVVISASHNPYEHNGIKMFSAEGFKLNDDLEARIETLILQKEPLPLKTHGDIGQVRDGKQYIDVYLDHLASTVKPLKGLRVAVDCANGAASVTARRLFDRYALDVTYLNEEPNGVNINDHCGSTHLKGLCQAVKDGGFDLGIAFDGDADRCLAVDEKGNPVDGDKIMSVCATFLRQKGMLKNEGFVATVMSNIGLHKFASAKGLRLLCANVGDRNVLELMQKEDLRLGGEQSGHIIFLDYMPTGDGQLAALQFLQILCESGEKVSTLAEAVTQYPQILINVPGPHDNGAKATLIANAELQKTIAQEEARLAGDGRILVRPSGTEALIRVMVEAGTMELAKSVAENVSDKVKNLQK